MLSVGLSDMVLLMMMMTMVEMSRVLSGMGFGWERDDFYAVLKKESPHRTTKEEAKVVVVVPRMNSGAGLSFGAASLDKKNGVKE